LAICLTHRWARRVDPGGHIIYSCTECSALVDWTDARHAYESLCGLAVTGPQQPSTLLADLHFEDPVAPRALATSLWDAFQQDQRSDKYVPIFFNVGATSSTGDSLGPLVGWFLKRKGFAGDYLGDTKSPVHATNLKEKVNAAWMKAMKRNKFPYIIAVDAAVGRPGRITINSGPLRPGAGMNKDLPHVGSVHVMAGTAHFPFMIWFSSIDETLTMAEVIADGLMLFHQQWEASVGRQG
jgi:putative sporulation protein YyaC